LVLSFAYPQHLPRVLQEPAERLTSRGKLSGGPPGDVFGALVPLWGCYGVCVEEVWEVFVLSLQDSSE